MPSTPSPDRTARPPTDVRQIVRTARTPRSPGTEFGEAPLVAGGRP
ncbi:hypothetical protein [Trujillonella humicola]